MDVLDIMQKAINDHYEPDVLMALDKGMEEIERLREALQSIKKVPNSEAAYGIIQVFVDDALKEKK